MSVLKTCLFAPFACLASCLAAVVVFIVGIGLLFSLCVVAPMTIGSVAVGPFGRDVVTITAHRGAATDAVDQLIREAKRRHRDVDGYSIHRVSGIHGSTARVRLLSRGLALAPSLSLQYLREAADVLAASGAAPRGTLTLDASDAAENAEADGSDRPESKPR